MKDTEGNKRRRRPDEDGSGETPPEPSPSGYTPGQSEALMSGLRILASVVVRAHTERRGLGSRTEPDRDGEDEGKT